MTNVFIFLFARFQAINVIKEESQNELTLVKDQLNGILTRMDNQDLKIQQQGQLIQQQGHLIQSQAREIELLKSQGNPNLDDSTIQRFEKLENEVEDLENKGKALTAPTCQHWAMYGVDQNGEYLVDPDGEMYGEPPFMAYCDFATNSTEVLHDAENMISIPKCNEIGCHEHSITYR